MEIWIGMKREMKRDSERWRGMEKGGEEWRRIEGDGEEWRGMEREGEEWRQMKRDREMEKDGDRRRKMDRDGKGWEGASNFTSTCISSIFTYSIFDIPHLNPGNCGSLN